MPATSPISLAAIRTPDAALGEQLRRDLAHELGELLVQLVDGCGQLTDPGDLIAGDPDPSGRLRLPQPAGDLQLPASADQGTLRDLPAGPQIVQLPAQLVDQPGPRVQEPLPMHAQKPDLELGSRQPRRRERVQPLAQRRARHRERIDRI